MSTLQVTTITTVNNTTPLILQTGNTGGGQIVLNSANADIQMLGDFKFSNTTFGGNLNFTGNVGIGTTTPQRKLHIVGPDGSAGSFPSNIGPRTSFILENNHNSVLGLITASGSYNSGIFGEVGGASSSYGALTFFHNSGSPYLTMETAGSERMRIDNNGQVGIGTSSPVTRFQTQISSGNNVGFFANIFPCAFGAFNNTFSAWNNLQIGPGTFFMNSGAVGLGTSSPSYLLHVANGSIAITSSTGAGAFHITDDSDSGRGLLLKSNHGGSSNTYVGTNSSIRNLVFGIDQVERMRLDTGGNVGIGTTSPNIRNSSGKVLAIAGTSITQPATIIQMGNKDAPGQGYSADETFYVSGIGSATEISRITASSLNGIGLYFRVKVAGHSASTGSGLNIKEYFYDGGSVTQISSTTTASIPPITTSVPSSGVVVVSLASANPAAGNFNGVVRIEWMAPVDFSGVNWTIS